MALNLAINNLSKSYNQTLVLNNVSFTIEAGVFTGLVGHNAAGKTTIFSLI